MEKYKLITYFLLGVMALSLVVYIGNNIYKHKLMKENPSFANGIIRGTATGSKVGVMILYQFKLGDCLYKGSSYLKSGDFFNIGDSCLIIYDKDDSSINDLYRDHLGRLHLLNKRDTIKEEWDMYIDSYFPKFQM